MKVALIGCGAVAKNHLIALSQMPQLEIVALCDVIPERAEAYRDAYAPNATLYTDYLKMLDEAGIETVHITTPHYLHADMTCAALSRNINVFLEKPIAINEEQIRRMLAAEAQSEAKINVCFQNRFNAATLTAKRIAEEHGGVTAARGIVTWKRTAPYYTESGWRGSYATEGGGVMINQAIHNLDLLIGFCGKPKTVIGTIANHHLHDVIEVEDTCEMKITFEGGAEGVFYATTAFPCDAPNILEFICADKTRITMIGDTLLCNGSPISDADKFKDENAVTPGKQCWGNGHRKLINMFYDALASSEPMPVSLRSAADAVLVLLAAYRSCDKTVAIQNL